MFVCQPRVNVGLTCLVRLNMGAGLVGQLCLALWRDKGVRRPTTGSKRSRLSTGKPSYLMGGKTHINKVMTFLQPLPAPNGASICVDY